MKQGTKHVPQMKVTDLKIAFRDGIRDGMGRKDVVLEKAFWNYFWKQLKKKVKV